MKSPYAFLTLQTIVFSFRSTLSKHQKTGIVLILRYKLFHKKLPFVRFFYANFRLIFIEILKYCRQQKSEQFINNFISKLNELN
jgi:hypothetical protein